MKWLTWFRRRVYLTRHLFKVSDTWIDLASMGIMHACHSTDYCDSIPEEGLELVAWFFPPSSKYGNGSCMMPISEKSHPKNPYTKKSATSAEAQTVEWRMDLA